MMSDKLYLAVCDSYEFEFRAAIKAESLTDVELITFPSLCARGRIDKKLWTEFIQKDELTNENVVVVSGEICDAAKYFTDHLKEAKVITSKNCFYHLAGSSIVDRFISQGGYLVTAGWLMNWEQYIEGWGFTKETIQGFFRDFAKRIIVLDTGVNQDCQQQATEFSQQAGLPYRIFTIDLMYIRMFVKSIVLEWRLREQKLENGLKSEIIDAAKSSAEYAMMFDIISKLSDVLTEQEMIVKLLDTFTLLFKPKKIGYYCIGRITEITTISTENLLLLEECIGNSAQRYIYTTSGRGFLLRIEFQSEVYGIVEIEDLAFPEYRSRYLSLMLNISKICGLAISNARKYETVKQSIDQLQYTNKHDQLTGVYNRFYFEHQLQAMKNNNNIHTWGIFVCDVDGLKIVNDSLGHMAGDQLIIVAASILKSCFRDDDIVARIGGDEFSVIIPNCTYEKAVMLQERIQQAIKKYNNERLQRHPKIPIFSLSVGFAVSDGSLVNVEKLFHEADTKMYNEKRIKKQKNIIRS